MHVYLSLTLPFCFLFSRCSPGQFVFALSSDDNSELWLSTDDSPLNLQLLVWVGKVRISFIFSSTCLTFFHTCDDVILIHS